MAAGLHVCYHPSDFCMLPQRSNNGFRQSARYLCTCRCQVAGHTTFLCLSGGVSLLTRHLPLSQIPGGCALGAKPVRGGRRQQHARLQLLRPGTLTPLPHPIDLSSSCHKQRRPVTSCRSQISLYPYERCYLCGRWRSTRTSSPRARPATSTRPTPVRAASSCTLSVPELYFASRD